MTRWSVVLRETARLDVDEAVAHYTERASAEVALGFVDALEEAFRAIGDNPDGGSPRYGHELDLPGLGSWPLRSNPFLIFHMKDDGCIDVWRVLHGIRDMPAWLQPS